MTKLSPRALQRKRGRSPLLTAILVIAGVAGCGAGDSSGPDTGGETLIAFPATFKDFRRWTSFHSDGPVDDGTFPATVLGPRTQYINQVPPHGSTEFPVGTIIVEARESGAQNIFAGVKRGGNFNKSGARNWEWFELSEATDGTVLIVWRGSPPVGGDVYGVDPNNACNGCHEQYVANDYVASPYLQLSNF
jgi:hypothetical protein